MDEALISCALDLSGRAWLTMNVVFPTEKIGVFDTELVREFFLAVTRTSQMTLHFHKMAGENSHHIAEAMFKGFGRALREATRLDPTLEGTVPSTKGVLA